MKVFFDGEEVPAVVSRKIDYFTVKSRVFAEQVSRSFERFLSHDWGNVSEDDWVLNDCDIENGGGALGAYDTEKGEIWVDFDGATLTVLFPDEY